MNKSSFVKHSMLHIHQENIKVGKVEHATKKNLRLDFKAKLTHCNCIAASSPSLAAAAASPDLSPRPAISTHRRQQQRQMLFLGHGSRTRGLVAGMATPGDVGARGEWRQPNPSGDVGTRIGDGIPRSRRM